MRTWMTYSKAKSRCTEADRCSTFPTVNCRKAASTTCQQNSRCHRQTRTSSQASLSIFKLLESG